jgi:hypothetical protein
VGQAAPSQGKRDLGDPLGGLRGYTSRAFVQRVSSGFGFVLGAASEGPNVANEHGCPLRARPASVGEIGEGFVDCLAGSSDQLRQLFLGQVMRYAQLPLLIGSESLSQLQQLSRDPTRNAVPLPYRLRPVTAPSGLLPHPLGAVEITDPRMRGVRIMREPPTQLQARFADATHLHSRVRSDLDSGTGRHLTEVVTGLPMRAYSDVP